MTYSEAKDDHLPSRWVRPAGLAIGSGLLALTIFAAVNVRRAHGRPFPSLLTDPFGSFSSISWPGWGPAPRSLRFPDHLVAIDGQPLPPPSGPGDLPARRLAARIAALRAAGQTQAQLTFATRGGPVTVTRAIRTLGTDEEAFFFVLYALIGLFVLWSGLAVVILARRRAGRLAYAGWTVGTFVFLVSFYDYHTTTALAPLFSLSVVCVQLCVAWLAYSFPEPPRRRRRVLLGSLLVLTIVDALAALALVVGPYLGADVTALRVASSQAAVLSLGALAVAILLRLRAGSPSRRQELLSAVWGIAIVPASLAVGFAVLLLTGTALVHLLLPFLAPLLPLSIGYSLIRHNILGTTAVLTRRMFVPPVMTGALVLALIVWLALHALLRTGAVSPATPWLAGGVTLVGLAAGGYRLSGRIFFAATARFRPTLQQLADDLASKRDVLEICRSIEAAVMRWLPTDSARVVLPNELHHIENRPAGYRARLGAGESVWTTEAHWRRHLLLPMRSQGGLRGVLVLAPKYQHALYTREDLELLETIASLGAVALHNADVIGELETLRRFEVDAARDDKRLALGLVGAEISHEIAYPLNFLRYLLRQGDAGRALDGRDLEIGREEIGRLERMFATLRKLTIPVPRREPVLVLPRVNRALDLIREALQAKQLVVSVEVPPDLNVSAEPDPVVQIFANLLRNAVQAVAPGDAIGVRSRVEPDGTVLLEVWDAGPGIPEQLASAIFNPFVTTKEGSMGLGLAVTQRLVRSFGWTMSVRRDAGRTVFSIEVPPTRPSRLNQEA
jgi:signal transduction histidine kinase